MVCIFFLILIVKPSILFVMSCKSLKAFLKHFLRNIMLRLSLLRKTSETTVLLYCSIYMDYTDTNAEFYIRQHIEAVYDP